MTQQGAIIHPIEVLVDGELVLPDTNGRFDAPAGSHVKVTYFVHRGICAEISSTQVGFENIAEDCQSGFGDNTRVIIEGDVHEETELASITIDTGVSDPPPHAGGPGAVTHTLRFNV